MPDKFDSKNKEAFLTNIFNEIAIDSFPLDYEFFELINVHNPFDMKKLFVWAWTFLFRVQALGLQGYRIVAHTCMGYELCIPNFL